MMIIKIVFYGRPITKKNSQRIIINKGKRMLLPSKQYISYEKDCLKQLTGTHRKGIDNAINLKAVYYMPTRNKVDLVNLLEATCDILVKGNVIADDNSNIVVSHDGSRVLYDKENPRVEIYINEKGGKNEEIKCY